MTGRGDRFDESQGGSSADHALHRLMTEIQEGLRHGYFEILVTCEVTSREQRRVTIHAGKTYQFMIPKDECVPEP